MSNPNWFSWYSFPFFAPLSGAVNQDIETNVVKVSELQKKVFEQFSLGQQLDALFAAVEELNRRPRMARVSQDPNESSSGEAMKHLEEMVKGMETIKRRHGVVVLDEAERALERLKAANPAQYETFIRDHETKPGSPGEGVSPDQG
ncbi:hypothetical protein [Bradyrhizobium neotropicale]|nr:hypothetical protein [Bradyrhizobium neotropicale]